MKNFIQKIMMRLSRLVLRRRESSSNMSTSVGAQPTRISLADSLRRMVLIRRESPSDLSTSAGALPTRISLARNSGFTLVETLVAITLLLLAIGGPMYAVSQSLASAIYARDQITAFYLAQDAIEYVRNTRDFNALNDRDWLYSISSYVESGSPFVLDTTKDNSNISAAISPCGSVCLLSYIHFNSVTGIYNYDAYSPGDPISPSPFTRTITLEKVDDNLPEVHEIRMTVDITWKTTVGGPYRQFRVVENLTSWVQ